MPTESICPTGSCHNFLVPGQLHHISPQTKGALGNKLALDSAATPCRSVDLLPIDIVGLSGIIGSF